MDKLFETTPYKNETQIDHLIPQKPEEKEKQQKYGDQFRNQIKQQNHPAYKKILHSSNKTCTTL